MGTASLLFIPELLSGSFSCSIADALGLGCDGNDRGGLHRPWLLQGRGGDDSYRDISAAYTVW